MNTDIRSILDTAAHNGLAHNAGAGGEILLVATEMQMRHFVSELTTLENLPKKLLNPGAIERDKQGYWINPALPTCDENVSYAALLTAFGLEMAHVWAESQLEDEVYDAMVEASDCSGWTPKPPEGDGWVLVSVHNSEDGDLAWFVRPTPKVDREDGRARRARMSAIFDRLVALADQYAKAEAAVGARGDLAAQLQAAQDAKNELLQAINPVAWIAAAAETGMEELLRPDARFDPPAGAGTEEAPLQRPLEIQPTANEESAHG